MRGWPQKIANCHTTRLGQTKKIERYRKFCAKAPEDFPLFCQDWYLDAVCGPDNWGVALLEKGGQIAAAWPYFWKKRWFWTYVAMPPLARMMGPYIAPAFRDLSKTYRLVEELWEQMPPWAAFEQDCYYHFQHWLPLYWKGFRQTTRYSYTLDIQNLDTVWENLAPDYRNQKIPKAQARLHTHIHTGPRTEHYPCGPDVLDCFWKVHNQSYQRQNLEPPIPFDLLERLDQALATRGQRAILLVENPKDHTVHSVAYLAWDRHSSYYLMAGDDPTLRQSGSGILATWEAIHYSAETLRLPQFDFCGSMVQAIERVRRQFGAVPQPYFRIRHERAWIFKMNGKW